MDELITNVTGARIGVGALVISRDGNILLLHRRGGDAAAWTIPGGAVDNTETPREAIVRELLEEAGLKPTEWRFDHAFEVALYGCDWLSHVFIVDAFEGTPTIGMGEPFDDIAWFPLTALPVLDRIALRTIKSAGLTS